MDDLSLLQKRYDRLIEIAGRMRTAWVKYSMYHSEADKNTALRHQRELDKILEEETKLKKSKQIRLL